jgi:hypothetical protein
MSFYYKFGTVETTTPWNRPTLEVFNEWWEEFKTFEGVSDYDFYLSGSFLTLRDTDKTWDVDVIVTGPIKNFVNLSDILKHGRLLGFQKKIFIDLFYYDSIEFCYGEISEENIKYYLKGFLLGQELKIVDGKTEVDRKLHSTLTPGKPYGSDVGFVYTKQPTVKQLNNKEKYHPTNRAKKLN